MIPVRVFAAPGVRSVTRLSWRAQLGISMAIILGRPQLWLTGALGFSMRGGILLLMLPILILPTPVEVRLLLGPSLSPSGLTADFWMLVTTASVVCSIVLVTLLLAIAWLEVSAFEHLVRDPEAAELGGWRPVPVVSPARRRRIIGCVFAVQVLGVLAVVLAAVPLVAAIGPTLTDELARPSSPSGILPRLVGRVAPQIVFIGAAILVAELLSAAATRYVLVRGYAFGRPQSARRAAAIDLSLDAARRVLPALPAAVATALTGWLASVLVLAPALWALGAVWQTTRATFLPSSSVADLLSQPSTLLVAALLAAVLFAALLLAGLASAFRAASWTGEMLRHVEHGLG